MEENGKEKREVKRGEVQVGGRREGEGNRKEGGNGGRKDVVGREQCIEAAGERDR